MRADEHSWAADEDSSIEEVFPSPAESLRLLPLYAAIVALILVPLWMKDQARSDGPTSDPVVQVNGDR